MASRDFCPASNDGKIDKFHGCPWRLTNNINTNTKFNVKEIK